MTETTKSDLPKDIHPKAYEFLQENTSNVCQFIELDGKKWCFANIHDVYRAISAALTESDTVRQRLEAAETEVERCHKRLEIDHVNHLYINPETGEEEMATEVIPMAARADAIDGIECRDDTIRLLEENRKALIASRDAAHQRHEAAAMQLTFMTEQFEHWHRIAHDRLVSANQLLDRARKAEEENVRLRNPKVRVEGMAYHDRYTVAVNGQTVHNLYDGKPSAVPVTFTFRADAQRAAFIAKQAFRIAASQEAQG